jgi:hypothetical protein
MSQVATPATNTGSRRGPSVDFRPAFATNLPLTLTGIVMVAVLGLALVGLVVDKQVITGAPAWLKPAKFAVSIIIYAFTLEYLLTFVRGHRWLVRVASWGTAVALLVEMAIIAGQVVRGTTSHFNVGTPLDSALYSIMGSFIGVVWTLGALVAVLLLIQRGLDPAWAWALRLGLLLSLVGMTIGVLMVANMAHSVGIADGGPGLPIVGWSTASGDLRAAHFFGLHGLQVLIFVGLLASRRAQAIDSAHRVALVWVAALAYLGLIVLLAWQALRGQSIVHPDGLMLTAFAALTLGMALALGALFVHARRAAGVQAPAWSR